MKELVVIIDIRQIITQWNMDTLPIIAGVDTANVLSTFFHIHGGYTFSGELNPAQIDDLKHRFTYRTMSQLLPSLDTDDYGTMKRALNALYGNMYIQVCSKISLVGPRKVISVDYSGHTESAAEATLYLDVVVSE